MLRVGRSGRRERDAPTEPASSLAECGECEVEAQRVAALCSLRAIELMDHGRHNLPQQVSVFAVCQRAGRDRQGVTDFLEQNNQSLTSQTLFARSLAERAKVFSQLSCAHGKSRITPAFLASQCRVDDSARGCPRGCIDGRVAIPAEAFVRALHCVPFDKESSRSRTSPFKERRTNSGSRAEGTYNN